MEHNNQAYTRIATRIKRRHYHERARTLQHHFDKYFLYVKQTEENCLIYFEKVAIKLFHKVKLVGRKRPILDKSHWTRISKNHKTKVEMDVSTRGARVNKRVRK